MRVSTSYLSMPSAPHLPGVQVFDRDADMECPASRPRRSLIGRTTQLLCWIGPVGLLLRTPPAELSVFSDEDTGRITTLKVCYKSTLLEFTASSALALESSFARPST